MKASVRHAYGSPDVLNVEEVQQPTPGDDELLVRVHAAGANLGDWEILTGRPFFIAALARLLGPRPRVDPGPSSNGGGGLFKPKYKILGCDVAGRVEAIGRNVTRFQPGDDVFGMCVFGSFAEYVCVPQDSPLVLKPAGMTFEQAAALPQAAFIALEGLHDTGQLQAGQKVLINGAGGGAGTLALQIAKSIGAEVTGVDSGKKLHMMRSSGADHVVDYAREDFTQHRQRYDVILDLAAHRSIFAGKRALAPGGIYIVAGGALAPTVQAALLGPWISRLGGKRVTFLMAGSPKEELLQICELFEAGHVDPIIDAHYSLSDVPRALQRLGDGQALGKVVISI